MYSRRKELKFLKNLLPGSSLLRNPKLSYVPKYTASKLGVHYFSVSAMTVTNNFLITVTTAVATGNNAIRCPKQDDEVEEVYIIATKLPLREAYSLKK